MSQPIGPSTALILVDLQAGTIPNARSLPADELLAAANTLVAALRAADAPVVFLRAIGMPRGRTAYSADASQLPPAFSEWLDAPAPADGDLVIEKHGWSGFTGTELDAELRRRDVSTVIIAGVATTFGVESTARSAYDLGYDVIVVTDAISDPSADQHEVALARRFPAMARLSSVAEVTGV